SSRPRNSPKSISSVRSSPFLPAYGFLTTTATAARRSGFARGFPPSSWISSTNVTHFRIVTATPTTSSSRASLCRRCGPGVGVGQVRREHVLAPVVVELAPHRVDVVGAVLGVVVLDDEGRPAERVVVAAARRV